MRHEHLHNALREHLEEWSVPLLVEGGLVFEEMPQERPDGSFVVERYAPQTSEPVELGPRSRIEHEGVYFLDVFVPAERGIGAAENLADSLLAHFAPRTNIAWEDLLVFVRSSSRRGALRDGPHLQVPCTVAWRANTQNPI